MSKKNVIEPKVLLGVYAIEITAEFFLEMLKFYRKNPLVDLSLAWKTSIAAAQTELAREAILKGFTHLLFIESDTYEIPDGALGKMLAYDKDVVSAYSYSRWHPYPANVYVRPERESEGVNLDRMSIDIEGYYNAVPNQGLIRVDYTSYQMMLIKTNVFEKLDFPWFTYLHGYLGVTDKPFCRNCEKNGVELWCDTNIVLRHHEVNTETREALRMVQRVKEEQKKIKTGALKNAVLTEEAQKRTEKIYKEFKAGETIEMAVRHHPNKAKSKKRKADPAGDARGVHNAGVLQRLHQPVAGVN